MPDILVPRPSAENPTQTNDAPFPKGPFNSRIDQSESRELPDWAPEAAENPDSNSGFITGVGESISIQFGDNTPLLEDGEQPGDRDVGNRKMFLDLTISDGDYSVETPTDQIPDKGWRLQQSQRLLANLATALNATEIVEDENGQEFVAIADNFVDLLRGNEFAAQEVGFVVFHGKPYKKNGADVIPARIAEFNPAV